MEAEPGSREELALAVAELWSRQNGWIPGGAIHDLEKVLGLPLPRPSSGSLDEHGRFEYDKVGPRLHGRESYTQWRARQDASTS